MGAAFGNCYNQEPRATDSSRRPPLNALSVWLHLGLSLSLAEKLVKYDVKDLDELQILRTRFNNDSVMCKKIRLTNKESRELRQKLQELQLEKENIDAWRAVGLRESLARKLVKFGVSHVRALRCMKVLDALELQGEIGLSIGERIELQLKMEEAQELPLLRKFGIPADVEDMLVKNDKGTLEDLCRMQEKDILEFPGVDAIHMDVVRETWNMLRNVLKGYQTKGYSEALSFQLMRLLLDVVSVQQASIQDVEEIQTFLELPATLYEELVQKWNSFRFVKFPSSFAEYEFKHPARKDMLVKEALAPDSCRWMLKRMVSLGIPAVVACALTAVGLKSVDLLRSYSETEWDKLVSTLQKYGLPMVKILLLRMRMTKLQEMSDEGEFYSIVVGSEEFEGDSELVGNCLLDEKCFNYSEQHVAVLKTPERGELAASFDEVICKARDSDTFLFVYSGHGFKEDDTDEFHFKLGEDKFPATEFRNKMEKIKCARKLVIIDSCYAGTLNRPKKGKGGKGSTSAGNMDVQGESTILRSIYTSGTLHITAVDDGVAAVESHLLQSFVSESRRLRRSGEGALRGVRCMFLCDLIANASDDPAYAPIFEGKFADFQLVKDFSPASVVDVGVLGEELFGSEPLTPRLLEDSRFDLLASLKSDTIQSGQVTVGVAVSPPKSMDEISNETPNPQKRTRELIYDIIADDIFGDKETEGSLTPAEETVPSETKRPAEPHEAAVPPLVRVPTRRRLLRIKTDRVEKVLPVPLAVVPPPPHDLTPIVANAVEPDVQLAFQVDFPKEFAFE